MSDGHESKGTALAVRSNGAMAQAFFDEGKFGMLQRAAGMFARSPLVPEGMRGKSKEEGIANCTIALAMAMEMGENPLIVMQNIYFVKGKAGWHAAYMIARANASGVFRGRIAWTVTGKGDALSVTAYATLADTGEKVEVTADMKMARAEKWTDNSKYQSMPEQMLKYRTATMLIRLYCPEVMLGYRTADELEDIAAAEAHTTKWNGIGQVVDAEAHAVTPESAAASLASAILPPEAATVEEEPESTARADLAAAIRERQDAQQKAGAEVAWPQELADRGYADQHDLDGLADGYLSDLAAAVRQETAKLEPAQAKPKRNGQAQQTLGE